MYSKLYINMINESILHIKNHIKILSVIYNNTNNYTLVHNPNIYYTNKVYNKHINNKLNICKPYAVYTIIPRYENIHKNQLLKTMQTPLLYNASYHTMSSSSTKTTYLIPTTNIYNYRSNCHYSSKEDYKSRELITKSRVSVMIFLFIY